MRAAVWIALAAASATVALGAPEPAGASPHHSHDNTGAAHSPQVQTRLAHTRAQAPPGAARGVDVADYQERYGINWSQVAGSGVRFAAIKATEGTYYTNPYAPADYPAARNAGLRVYAYAFAIPNGNGGSASPATQADYLVNYLHAHGVSPLPETELDIEYNPYSGGTCYGLSPSQMVAWVNGFAHEIVRRTGREPLIYAPVSWWQQCAGSSSALAQTPLWVPYYCSSCTQPHITPGWSRWAFWQYSATGSVPGINCSAAGGCDVDVLTKTWIPLLDPGNRAGPVGTAVSLQVQAADKLVTLTYKATGLPPGLKISTSGKVSGTLTTAGTYKITVTAAGSNGLTGTVSFTWAVT
jgi:GH25 family lysozyme M1 (1,4-beta-N-acetylmuramidase)